MEIGRVEEIFRYPVKSMGGERLEVANLGWHGLDGDRRLAFRRIDDRSGFPWLTASKLPDLLLFAPHRHQDGVQVDLPTHIRTPVGDETFRLTYSPVEAIAANAGPASPPMLLVRAGKDMPALNETIALFTAAALERNLRLTLVNLPDAVHAFDLFDDTAWSRAAIEQASPSPASTVFRFP